MRTLGTLLLIGALMAAAFDWFAVATKRSTIEALAKPAVMAMLIAAVALAGDTPGRWFIIAGLFFSLVGDVALLEQVDRFISGLAAFLIAHIFYAFAFVSAYNGGDRHILLVVVGVVLLLALGQRGVAITAAAAQHDGRLRGPVMLYIGALAAMTLAASANTIAGAVGAWLFATSDAVLGWNRFVRPLPNGRLATHVLYHLGQVFFAVWAIGP